MGGFEGYTRIDLTPDPAFNRRYFLRWCLKNRTSSRLLLKNHPILFAKFLVMGKHWKPKYK